MDEQRRKHELVVVVGVRNIEQQEQQYQKHQESQLEPARRRAIEVNETSSSVEITYENERVVAQVVDEQQQTSDLEEYLQDDHNQQRQYVNMMKQSANLEQASGVQQIPEPATRMRRQHHLQELIETDEEEQEQEEATIEYTSQQAKEQQERAAVCQEMALEQQLTLMRDLLRIERANSEQRRHNNQALKKYIDQLQADYLRQQSDLMQALEFSHKLKGQKDSQLACLETSLREKESLIEQLNVKLASLDETKLQEEFSRALERQRQLKQVEHEQIRAQVEAIELQLTNERARGTQLASQIQEKLDDQLRQHEKELGATKSRLTSVQEDLERVLSEPQNLVIRALREEKSQLTTNVDELQLVVHESQARYESIKRRLDELLVEQKQANERHQMEVDQAHAQQAEQRQALQELRLQLEDREEVNQILRFNLSRSEKRVKNLLGSLKAKEASYRELIGVHEARHQQETERLKNELQAKEKRLIEIESELGKKQNELVRLQLEQENQLESLRNDRDERLRKMTQEKLSLERDQQATELRCARELEQARETSNLVDKLRGELEQLRAEGKRISIELTKSEAKLYAKQQELTRVGQRAQELEQQQQQQQALATCSAGGELNQQVDKLTRELELEQKLTKRLRGQLEDMASENEKLCVKLKIAETNVDKMSSMLRRDHSKMMLEYEKRLEQIRSEQIVFDRNKLRYKRYGYKLKRYCEHLRRVHEHLCSPANCGYAISAGGFDRQGAAVDPQRVDRVSLLSCGTSDSDESLQDGYEEIYEEIDASPTCTHPDQSNLSGCGADKSQRHSADRFLIKRTGGPSTASSGSPSQKQQQHHHHHHLESSTKSTLKDATSRQHQQYPRTPLKPRNQQPEQGLKVGLDENKDKDQRDLFDRTSPPEHKQSRRPSSWQPNQENRDDRHAYYYIRTGNENRLTPTLRPGLAGRRTSAATRSLTPVACRQTKLSLARAKVRHQQKPQQHLQRPLPMELKLCRAVI